MNSNQVKKYCLSFSGVKNTLLGEPSNILSFYVGSKKFAYFKTSEPERWRFSVRVLPERFLELTDQANVKPARYMQRFHWVSVIKADQFDEAYLRELITWSYQKALSSLSKKEQARILGHN